MVIKKKSMDEFNLINMCDKLLEFKLITEKQKQNIISKNRKRDEVKR